MFDEPIEPLPADGDSRAVRRRRSDSSASLRASLHADLRAASLETIRDEEDLQSSDYISEELWTASDREPPIAKKVRARRLNPDDRATQRSSGGARESSWHESGGLAEIEAHFGLLSDGELRPGPAPSESIKGTLRAVDRRLESRKDIGTAAGASSGRARVSDPSDQHDDRRSFARGDAGYGTQRSTPLRGRPDDRRALVSEAVAEITRHQRRLEEPARTRADHPAVHGLRDDVSRLGARLDAMRADRGGRSPAPRSNQRDDETFERPRRAAAPSSSYAAHRDDPADDRLSNRRGRARQRALDVLRSEIGDLSRNMAGLASREDVGELMHAVRALAERVEDSREGGIRDSVLRPVDDLLHDLHAAVVHLADRPLGQGLEREIRTISGKIDAMERKGVDAHTFERLLDQIGDIRQLLGAAIEQPTAVEALGHQIADLQGRIDHLIESHGRAGTFELDVGVRNARAALDTLPGEHIIRALEERIESLGSKIDAAIGRMDQPGARGADTGRLERMMRDISVKLESTVQSPPDLGPLQSLMGDISRKLDTDRPSGDLRALEKFMSDLVRKVERPATLPPGGLAAIEKVMGDVARKLDRAANGQGDEVRALRRTVEMLSERIEDLQARPASPVSRELEEVLRALANKIDRVDKRAAAPMQMAETLVGMVRDLADKVEASRTPHADNAAFDALQSQIERLADRIDHADHSSPALEALHGTLTDLFSELADTRESARATAEQAARDAMRDAMSSSGAGAPPEVLTRELADLRSSQDAADRRMQSTLTAVHETLEKVVERLAMLEDDMADGHSAPRPPTAAPSRSAGLPPATPMPPLAAASQKSSPLAAENQKAPPLAANQKVPPLAANQKNAPLAPPPLSPKMRAPEPPASARGTTPDIAVAPELAIGSDFLIEPGSGRAPRSAASAAPIPEVEPTSSASGFIAAARRAVNANAEPSTKAGRAADDASAEAAKLAKGRGKNPEKSADKASDLEAIRAKARAAAAQAQNGQSAKSRVPAPAAAPSRDRRRLLYGLAAVVVMLCSLQALRLYGDPTSLKSIPGVSAIAHKLMRSGTPSKSPNNAPAAASPRIAPTPTQPDANAPSAPDAGAVAPGPAAAAEPAPKISAQVGTGYDPLPVGTLGAQSQASGPLPAGLTDAAGRGNRLAQYELAQRYAEGRGTTRDFAQSAQWFEKAAAQDLAPAQYRIAVAYEKGIGVPRDTAAARKWYRRAADAGNSRAMHNLAVLTADAGADGKPDYVNAAVWFRKAAEYGVRDSQYNLAILYARGLGVDQSLAQSYTWFAIAAAQGDADAGHKRDDVGQRLEPKALADAKAAVDRFRPRPEDPTANDVPATASWDNTAPRASVNPPAKRVISGL